MGRQLQTLPDHMTLWGHFCLDPEQCFRLDPGLGINQGLSNLKSTILHDSRQGSGNCTYSIPRKLLRNLLHLYQYNLLGIHPMLHRMHSWNLIFNITGYSGTGAISWESNRYNFLIVIVNHEKSSTCIGD